MDCDKTYTFCDHCAIILNHFKGEDRVRNFVDDDFGLTNVEHDMIEARRLRAKGNGPWQKKDKTLSKEDAYERMKEISRESRGVKDD